MKKILSFCFSVIVCSNVYAQNGRPKTCPAGTLLDAVALNAAAASRTFTVGPTVCGSDQFRGYTTLLIDADYTYANTGTISFTCTGTAQDSASAATRTLTTCTTASGTCTLNWAGVVTTPSLTASKAWTFPIGITGLGAIKCVVSHSGAPAAGDVVTVTGVLVADGGTR